MTIAETQPFDDDLGELVDQMVDQIQAGEMVDLDLMVTSFPEMAERLRCIYPTLRAMFDWNVDEQQNGLETEFFKGSGNQPIGDFRIVQQIGRGGMGVVYEAEQLSVSRRVALKILPLASLVAEKALQRFHNEVRAAASLDHPNIVTIHTVGEERGIHFYAMQLIRGQSLAAVIRTLQKVARQSGSVHGGSIDNIISDDNHADSTSTDREDSASPQEASQHETVARGQSDTAATKFNQDYFRNVCRLMIQAAQALHHAHQRGVIHRDIKPGNLLLNKDHQLFVTDFGLARIEADPRITVTGDVFGTLRYMSPEQVLSNRVIIDHRTDVYSLGATLFEMLTLQSLITAKDRPEIIRQISLQDPKPPRRINANIPKDLETIVLKSTQKNPGERYQNAQEMSDDLQRFLDNKPVAAKRPTAVQCLNKWMRRNPTIMWATILLLLLSTIGTTISTGLVMQANGRTQQALSSAERRAKENRAVVDFLINDMLAAATPEISGGRKLTVEQVLANAEKRLGGKFEDYPLVEASVRHALGATYLSLSDYWAAEIHLQRARQIRTDILGFGHPDTLLSAQLEASSLTSQGRTEEGLRLIQDTLEAQIVVLGEIHKDTLKSKTRFAFGLYEWGQKTRAEQLLKQVIEAQQRQNDADKVETILTRATLGVVLYKSKKYREAKQVFDALELDCNETLGSAHRQTFYVQYYQGMLLPEPERHKYLADVLAASRIVLGEDNNLVMFIELGSAGSNADLKEGQKLLEELLAKRSELPGDFNPSSLQILIELEKNLRKQEKFVEAEQRYREGVEAFINRANMQLNEARDLNWAARRMLTVPPEYKESYDPLLALGLAMRACTLASNNGDPQFAQYLITLSLAEHKTGDTAQAVETQKRAMTLLPEGTAITVHEEFETQLQEYEAALRDKSQCD